MSDESGMIDENTIDLNYLSQYVIEDATVNGDFGQFQIIAGIDPETFKVRGHFLVYCHKNKEMRSFGSAKDAVSFYNNLSKQGEKP